MEPPTFIQADSRGGQQEQFWANLANTFENGKDVRSVVVDRESL
jgi:hypothetical protein